MKQIDYNNPESLKQEILNLTNEITRTPDNKVGNKSPRKLCNTGWLKIPNCEHFDIELKGVNPNWKELGIDKNFDAEIEITPYKNRGMNRYMKYQISQLRKYKTEPTKYWKLVWFLMIHSSSFRLSAINNVFSNWYKDLSYYSLVNINKKATRIIMKQLDDLEYKRVYIPKGDSFRPLGVPTPAWRLVTHMFSNFLYIFVESYVLPSQHGFIPGKGTLTAWKEIVDKVLDSPWIYECDLEQFFPSVHSNEISKVLIELDMPKRWVYWLQNLNICQPELPEELKLDESRYIMTKQDHYEVMNGIYNPESRMYDPVRDFIACNGIEILYEVTGKRNIFEIVQEQWAIFDHYSPSKVVGMMEGVPQGLPTSPITSILTLKEFLTQVPSVSYADDPIFYNDKEFVIKEDLNKGIKLNKSKSGWVRRNGEWLRPLKYLGLTYDPTLNSIKSSVRSGGDLLLSEDFRDKILSKRIILESNSENYIESGLKNSASGSGSNYSWKDLFKAKFMGLLQARLYSNSWSTDNIDQDFVLKAGSKSWLEKKFQLNPILKREWSVFTVSSRASNSLYYSLNNYKRKKLNLGVKVRKFENYKLYKLSHNKNRLLRKPK